MTITAQEFSFVRELVLTRSAIVLDPGKEYLVESRLLPIARRRGDTDVAGLIKTAQRSPEAALKSEIVDALTTNETSWFRDRHPFDALGNHILPELVKTRALQRRLSIWSAACSSGQEPYSIAMTLADKAPVLAGWQTSILATDLSPTMIERARGGLFSQLEMNRGLPASHLVRHFARDKAGWRVAKQLRDLVTFQLHNLNDPAPPGPFDIVFLRNVLIYFAPQTKREILARVRRVLRPDGFLILGAAETTLNLDTEFDRAAMGPAPIYRIRDPRG